MRERVTGKRSVWRGGIAAALSVCLLLSGLLQGATVHVAGGSGAGSEAFLTALARELGGQHQVAAVGSAGRPDIVISLHEGSLQEARASGPVVLAILPEPDHAELQAGEGALYWAPSWADQLRLAKRIFPSIRRVGLLLEDSSEQPRARALKEYARKLDVELVTRVAEPDLVVRIVAELAGSSDVIVAPADSRLFSRHTLKPILLAAYRQNRVFIGPTPAVVRAGALASLHVSPGSLALETAERIRRYLKDGRWGPPSRISRFDVTTNPQVARSLGLRLPDQEQLTREWRTEESTPWP